MPEEEAITLKAKDIYPELKDSKTLKAVKNESECVAEVVEAKEEKEEASTELIELRSRLQNRERTIQTLRETVMGLEKEIVELRKRLNEPVTLTTRGGQELPETPEGEMTAAHALKRMRDRGEI